MTTPKRSRFQRPCLDCGRRTYFPRCDECTPKYLRRQAEKRLVGEPWRAIYGSAAWKRARSRVLEAAGYRCTVRIHTVEHPEGRLCGRPAKDVHHTKKLRDIWLDHGEEACTASAFLVAVCKRCHPVVEAALSADRRSDAEATPQRRGRL